MCLTLAERGAAATRVSDVPSTRSPIPPIRAGLAGVDVYACGSCCFILTVGARTTASASLYDATGACSGKRA